MTDQPPTCAPEPSDDDRRDLLAFQADNGRHHLDALWRRNAGQFWRLARGLCGDLAEDALQESALCLLRHADRWRDRGPGSATAWLMTVVANAAREQKRRARRADLRLLPAPAELVAPAPPADHARLDDLQQALERLDRRTRQAVELRYLAGLDFPAVAAALGVPVRTARTRVSRALATLRQRLGIAAPGGSAGVLVWLAPIHLPNPPTTVADLVAKVDVAAGGPDLAALLPATLPKAGLLLGGASAAAIAVLVLGAVHLAPAVIQPPTPPPMPAPVVADPPVAPPAADAAAADVLRRPVSVSLHGADLDEALLQIDRQLPHTGRLGWTLMAGSPARYYVRRNSLQWGQLPLYGRLDLVLTAPLAQVLDHVTAPLGLAWEMRDETVCLVRRSTPQERAAWAATWRDTSQDQRRRLSAAGAAAQAGDVQALQFLVMTLAEARSGWGYALVELGAIEDSFDARPMYHWGWHKRSVYRLLPEPAALDPFLRIPDDKTEAGPLIHIGARASRPSALEYFWSTGIVSSSFTLGPAARASLLDYADGKPDARIAWVTDRIPPGDGDAAVLRRCLNRALVSGPRFINPFLGSLLRCGEEPTTQALASLPRPLSGPQRQATLDWGSPYNQEVLHRLPWTDLKILVGDRPEADGAYLLLNHPAAIWDAGLFERVLTAPELKPRVSQRTFMLDKLAARWPREVAPVLAREVISSHLYAHDRFAVTLGRISTPAGVTLPIAAWESAPVNRRRAARLRFLAGQGAPALMAEATATLEDPEPFLRTTAAGLLVQDPNLSAGGLLALVRRDDLPLDARMVLFTGIAPRLPDPALASWLLAQDLAALAFIEQAQGYGITAWERPTRVLIAHLARLAAIGDPVQASAAISRIDALTAAGPAVMRFDAWLAAQNLRQIGLTDLPVPARPPPPPPSTQAKIPLPNRPAPPPAPPRPRPNPGFDDF